MRNILILADYRGWAWDIKAKNISNFIKPYGYEVSIKYYYDYFIDPKTKWHDIGYIPGNKITFDSYDSIIFFSQKIAKSFNSLFCLSNAYVGICSHMNYNGSIENSNDIDYLNRFKGVFAINKLLYSIFSKQVKNLYYCPNGVDTNHFQYTKAQANNERIIVGWIGDEKHACEKGYYDFIKPLASLGFDLRICNKHKNYRQYSDLPNFYQSIDTLICSSKSEGTPNPALEASACGKPIISTPVGNMPEFIVDGWNGFFINRDISDIVLKLNYLSSNKKDLYIMGKNARTQAEHWSWKENIKYYVRMLSTPQQDKFTI